MQSINLDYLLRARRYLGELIPNDGHLVCLPVSISAKSVGFAMYLSGENLGSTEVDDGRD